MPDRLFQEARRIVAENEMSLAEVVRRGLEELVQHHPPNRSQAQEWSLPSPVDMGEPMIDESKWTEMRYDDGQL